MYVRQRCMVIESLSFPFIIACLRLLKRRRFDKKMQAITKVKVTNGPRRISKPTSVQSIDSASFLFANYYLATMSTRTDNSATKNAAIIIFQVRYTFFNRNYLSSLEVAMTLIRSTSIFITKKKSTSVRSRTHTAVITYVISQQIGDISLSSKTLRVSAMAFARNVVKKHHSNTFAERKSSFFIIMHTKNGM